MPRCACKRPSPVTEHEDWFGPLFADTPEASFDRVACTRCGGTIRDWRPCAPNVEVAA